MQDSETVRDLLSLVKSHVSVWRSTSSAKPGNARTLCEGYTDESYASMNQDTVRNTFYKRCIDYAIRSGARTVLEIGPGDSALLTRMAALAHANVFLQAVEVNKISYNKACVLLRDEIKQGRCKLVNGYSTELKSSLQYDALLFEILGNVASSEGVVLVTKDLIDRGIISHAQCIPAAAATFITPVRLASADLNRQDVYIGENMISIRSLHVQRTNLCSDVALLESLCFSGHQHFEEPGHLLKHESLLTVQKSGVCHGLGTFIVVCGNGKGRSSKSQYRAINTFVEANTHAHRHRQWISTDSSDGHHAAAWRNIVFLFDNPLQLEAQDLIQLQCQTLDATTLSPRYEIKCTVHRSNLIIFEDSRIHSDLQPTYTEQT
jgi:hypothetical protein